MTDLVIRGGVIYDGTGKPPRRADVAIGGRSIVAVEADIDQSASEVIDATGLAVAPGFIDFHSHADFTLPAYPDAVNSISQGVTTELVGNCGFSPAPLSRSAGHATAFQSSCAAIGPDLTWRWTTFTEYLRDLAASRPTVNCAPLVGHNAVRAAVMGFEDRPPTEAELGEMVDLVAGAMDAGAWGLSSGLIYAPGTYAGIDELATLGGAVADAGGIYASHVRNEGAGLIDAVTEALEVGRRTGVTVQVSHLKATGVENRGLVHDAMASLDDARTKGVHAYCDVYPYTAGSTFLAMLTPGWAQEGGLGELVNRLSSAENRNRIRHEMLHGLPGWNSILSAVGSWDRVVISSVTDRALASYEGQSVATLAAAANKDPFEFTFDLLVEDSAGTAMVVFLMDEGDVRAVLEYPWSVIGSDQLLVTGRERKTHPRCYGTFAKALGPLVRDEGLFSLETAVHKMSGLPATVLGMTDRGRIAPGLVADLVLFDPETVTDRADYESPTALALGIEVVLIGGQTAFVAAEPMAARLGNVLLRSR